MTLADLLHDRVDAQEELRERARAAIDQVVRQRLSEALEVSDGNAALSFTMLALWGADALAGITTDAVHTGADHAKKRGAL